MSPRRTRKVHVTEHDAIELLNLAVLTEDRTDDEHQALVRLATKVDRLAPEQSPPCGWVTEVEHTRVLDALIVDDADDES